MFFLRRKLFIYPEIQMPILKQVMGGLFLLSILQILGVSLSMVWLRHQTQLAIELVVDYRLLQPWKNLLYLSIILPILVNILIGIYLLLFISNRFAGPLFRLERELDKYIENGGKLQVHFRENDNLKALAHKVNLAFERKLEDAKKVSTT
ncbi:MAG: hypothetical protein H7061_06170 [Bdellovibrionaceae bacterium]|nr:hypothetical protein [Bdellovibrio sp.]